MVGGIKRVWVVAVPITDFQKSLSFYRDILGLKVQLDGRKFNWMELGPNEPLCKIGLSLVEPSKSWRTIGSVTGIVLDTDNIQKFYEHMIARNVKFTTKPTRQPWGGIVANFLDPDGNQLQAVEHDSTVHYSTDSPPEGEPSLRDQSR